LKISLAFCKSKPPPILCIINPWLNGIILGNWTIDSTENISSELSSFNQGPIYRGNLSTGYFNIQGEAYNSEEQISICSSPIFAPISLAG
jgi:hypothetical protein